jgi:hypothetical protein
MGLDAKIRRVDRRPMGTPEDVRHMLSAIFPGIAFAIGPEGGWTGTFDILEKDGFAIQF